MNKLIYSLLFCVIFTGCSKRIETSYESLVSVLVGKAVLGGNNPDPSPGPQPNTKHLRKDCPFSGWIIHGDGHKTPCPDCIDSSQVKVDMPQPNLSVERHQNTVDVTILDGRIGIYKNITGELRCIIKDSPSADCPDGVCPLPKKDTSYATKEEVRDIAGEMIDDLIKDINKEFEEEARDDAIKNGRVVYTSKHIETSAEKKLAKERHDYIMSQKEIRRYPPPAANPVKYTEWKGWLWKWEDNQWNAVKQVKHLNVMGYYDYDFSGSGQGSCSSGSCGSGYYSSGGSYGSGGCSGGSCGGGSGFFRRGR